MATIKEVAKKARVSVGTVSNVLSGSRKVSPAFHERVTNAIKSLDYYPNHNARSLKTRQTHLLGMVISDITNPYFPRLVRGAEDAAQEGGYLLVTANTDHQIERERSVISVLRNRRVDGILLVVAPSVGNTDHITSTIASGIPIVCLDRVPKGIRLSSVAVDAVRSSEMCVRHLVSMGHRSIGIITGHPLLQNAIDRLQGYRNVLKEAKIPEQPSLIATGDFRFESGYLSTKQLMLSEKPPSALFVCNGVMGLGALKALRELSIRCPEDVALAVFDELPGSESFSPSITVVAQPEYQIGYQGAKLLISHIESGPPAKPVEIRLDAEQRIRQSTSIRLLNQYTSSPGRHDREP